MIRRSNAFSSSLSNMHKETGQMAHNRTNLKALLFIVLFCMMLGVFHVAIAGPPMSSWLILPSSGPTNLPPQQSEAQRVVIDAEGGSFTLTFSGQTTTALPFDAEPGDVAAALTALPNIGGAGGSVSVSGGPGDLNGTSPYAVVFNGSLANANQPALVANAGGLTGVDGHHTATVTTILDGGVGTTQITIYAQNIGGLPSAGTTTLTFSLPPGVSTEKTPTGSGWNCLPVGAGQVSVTCTSNGVAEQGFALPPVRAAVMAGPGAASGAVHITIEGGGSAGIASYDMPLVVSALPAPPGLQSFNAGAYDNQGIPDHRAGGHPYSASTGLMINTKRTAAGKILPSGEFRDIVAHLPSGFIGNPLAVPQCPDSEKTCSTKSIIATAAAIVKEYGIATQPSEVYDIDPPKGLPAKFRFSAGQGVLNGEGEFERPVIVNLSGALRSDEDFGVDVASRNTPQIQAVFGTFFTVWGTPGSSSHDTQRCEFVFDGTKLNCGPGGGSTALLTNPSGCSEEAKFPPVTLLDVTTWQSPGDLFTGTVPVPAVTECDALEFAPEFFLQPASTEAASPSATVAHLHIDQADLLDPDELAPPHLKRSVVDLPVGLTVNPSAADGMEACTTEQIGLTTTSGARPNRIRFDKEPVACPDSSKLGTVEIDTPLLKETLNGVVYLAAQEDNPFNSLLAIYIVVEDEQTGTIVKLPGEVIPNPQTGQMRAIFDDNPQLPVEDLRLKFRGGQRSALATPDVCAKYTTTGEWTPWSAPESGPPAQTNDSFNVMTGAGGSPACPATKAARPFNLGFQAGSTKPVAGAHSPFTLRITRPDGNQELDTVTVKTPPGFAATLKGVGICSDDQVKAAQAPGRTGRQEMTNPSCPASSQVGTTTIGAGVGSQPLYVKTGKVYLTGPYKKAPVSLTFIVPAVAGPFDLGVQVVKTALNIDPKTAQVTAESDQIPQILKGIPLLIRDVRVDLDRSNFALNPTSCEPMSITSTVTGGSGATASLSSRFQVGECDKLGFKPSLKLQLHGKTRRAAYQRLEATVTYPKQGAYSNIARASVALPHSEFLAQEHINTVCTRVQFAAHACPAGSIYGHAEASSPLLDGVLAGPVYLRSSNNPLPDLVVALRGPDAQPIEVELAGRTDSINGGIRNTFDVVPDAPVSKFTLRLFGGKKSLIVNSRNLCKGPKQRATVKFTAHNGETRNYRPVVRNDCGKKKAKKGK
jgi:hypothetical protein